MVSAINSSTFTPPLNAAASTGGLEARLARYQKELSDCVNCDSAKTLEGKQKIQDVANKISEIKTRIDEVAAAKTSTHPAAITEVAPPSGQAFPNVGSRLDVFA